MLRFYAGTFTKIAREVEKASVEAKHSKPEELNEMVSAPEVQAALQQLSDFKATCGSLNLESAVDQIERMISLLSAPCAARDLVQSFVELQNRIYDQLARRLFLQLDPTRSFLYGIDAPCGIAINEKFPEAVKDLKEAANWYAVERNAATVYHLMKVMEVVLRRLAKKLQVRYSPSWGTYLTRIQGKLEAKSRKSRMSRKRLQFLAECATRLTAVKDAWRDPTMHVAAEYTDYQTIAIFNTVTAFVDFMKDV
jgi:hypothetical protein